MERIGIIASGQHVDVENWDWSVEDMVFFTVRDTLRDNGLTLDDIDTVVQAGDDVMDGIAINHVYTIEPAGAFMKEESKVETDGAWGAMYAMARLRTGKFRTAMIVAQSKASQVGRSAFSGISADPFYLRPVGADSDSIAALQAGYFSGRSGATEEDFANVAVKNRGQGKRNSRALQDETGDFSTADVLGAPPIATPLTELSASRAVDGCVVSILATESYIKEKGLSAAYLTGVGFTNDAYYPTFRELDKVRSAEEAAKIAYRMAGTSPENIDMAELHETYAHQELMLYEALGFCPAGDASQLIRDGRTKLGGDLPVNASGGALCGNIIYGSGLQRLNEAALQVMGKAGDVQVPGAKTAVAHSQAGLAMQANIVFVVES